MKEIVIIAEILFLEIANKSFNFPITNSIRISLWLSDSNQSTFSEIQLGNEKLEIGENSKVRVKLLEQEFLQNKIKEGTEFMIGTYPEVIAKGKVIKVE